MAVLDTDYLIIGAGLSGMGFADSLIAESDADVVMVDRRHRPGGHWNDAYPFVRLHMPSAKYGVNSRVLGRDQVDEIGPNTGLYQRATAGEICGYFDRVLQDHLLPSGQVRFFGMCDYRRDRSNGHQVVSRLTGCNHGVGAPQGRRRHLPRGVGALDAHAVVRGRPAGAADSAQRSGRADRSRYGVHGHRGRQDRDGRVPMAARRGCPRRRDPVDPASGRVAARPCLLPAVGTGAHLRRGVVAGNRGGGSRRERRGPDSSPRRMRAARPTRPDGRANDVPRCVGERGRDRGPATHRERGSQGTGQVHRGRRDRAGGRVAPHWPRSGPCGLHGRRPQDGSRPADLRTRPDHAPAGSTEAAVLQRRPHRLRRSGSTRRCGEEPALPTEPYPDSPVDWIPNTFITHRTQAAWLDEPDLTAWMEGSRVNIARGIGDHMDAPGMKAAIARLLGNMQAALTNLEALLASTEAATPVG